MRPRWRVAALGLLVAYAAGGRVPATAAEALTLPGVIGSGDFRQALLPAPGLYGALSMFGANVDKYHLSTSTETQMSGSQFAGGAALAYVYDAEVFGGRIASTLSVSAQELCIKVTGPTQCVQGLRDMYSDLLLWSRLFPSAHFAAQPKDLPQIPYGLAVQFGLGTVFPTGAYSAQRSVNNSGHVFDVTPNMALTYTVPSIFGGMLGRATEISARTFYNTYSRNDATGYHNGNVVNINFAVSERFDSYQVGLVGLYVAQLNDDTRNGIRVPPDGRRAELLALGPAVSYTFKVDEHPFTVTVKSLISVYGAYQTGGETFSIRLGTKL
ncbi:SphA family protein [Bradyrhizobium prioriisuperbiae]|uniref:SphA family protein n=1 Tax=Bradyrhizobium prioriisuperbiae TaxID=2854389 RepID=UPI0028E7C27D|nr:transporter [Bradyrhizobium prioritasuperba]